MPISLPITITPNDADEYNGIEEIEGMVRFEANNLTIEYRYFDESEQWSPVEEVHLAMEDIGDLELRKRWYGWHIVIRINRLQRLESMPGLYRGDLKLYLSRRDRAAAQNLVTRAQLALSEWRLAQD